MKEYINGWTKEKVIEHVTANFKGKSVSSTLEEYGNSCAYRGDNGKKCIAGCFIPDDLYKPSMEGTAADYIGVSGLYPLSGLQMCSWQALHDELPLDMEVEEQLQILLDFLEK